MSSVCTHALAHVRNTHTHTHTQTRCHALTNVLTHSNGHISRSFPTGRRVRARRGRSAHSRGTCSQPRPTGSRPCCIAASDCHRAIRPRHAGTPRLSWSRRVFANAAHCAVIANASTREASVARRQQVRRSHVSDVIKWHAIRFFLCLCASPPRLRPQQGELMYDLRGF